MDFYYIMNNCPWKTKVGVNKRAVQIANLNKKNKQASPWATRAFYLEQIIWVRFLGLDLWDFCTILNIPSTYVIYTYTYIKTEQEG